MDLGNPKVYGVFVNALTGSEIIRELTPEEIAELPEEIAELPEVPEPLEP